MAWDSNEKYSYAWLTKEASEHEGVESFINDIENNAKCEMHIEDLKKCPIIIIVAFGLGALGKAAYDKLKLTYKTRKELNRKSNIAKEAIRNGAKADNVLQTIEDTSKKEEEL